MYHAAEDNRLYNLRKGIQVDIELRKGKSTYDIIKFLDDTSLWMNNHNDLISEKYLPFSMIAVGLSTTSASAFMYGVFVGRQLEKNGIRIEAKSSLIDRNEITAKVKKSISQQMNFFKSILRNINEDEDKNDKTKETEW